MSNFVWSASHIVFNITAGPANPGVKRRRGRERVKEGVKEEIMKVGKDEIMVR